MGAEPKHTRAFFSPWFGMDPADNLNLIQPVNPWSGSSWAMYTEYYQWSPTHNSNSKQVSVCVYVCVLLTLNIRAWKLSGTF